MLTWKTVIKAMGNVSKFVGGVPFSKLNWPPKSCMPKSANIKINKNKRNKSDIMERMEFNNDITRFRKEDQYLKKKLFCFNGRLQLINAIMYLLCTYLVTLNILSNLKALNTEKPNDPVL